MSGAIRVLWYDIAEGEEQRYLEWLHDEHLPALSARPGVTWAAHYRRRDSETNAVGDGGDVEFTSDPTVGVGRSFFLLVGAVSSDVFYGRDWVADGRSTDEHFAQHAARRDLRTCIFLEESHVDGPNPRPIGGPTAPVIQLGTFTSRAHEDDLELGAFYRQLRLPVMARTPGCVRATKLVASAGWARHGILYEFVSVEGRSGHFEKHVELGAVAAEPAEEDLPYVWHGRHPKDIVYFAPSSPSVGERIWPPVTAGETS